MRLLSSLVLMVLLLCVGYDLCHAFGGKLSYPDGGPVVGATVHLIVDEQDRLVLTSDAAGRFKLPDNLVFFETLVQIQAPEGKDFATVNLPAELFESGDVAFVLQPKR